MGAARIRLSADDPQAGQSLDRSVAALLRDRGRGAQIDVELYGNDLPAQLVAALIGNLRRLREDGGTLAVEATTPGLRSALAAYGLERVLARAPGAASGAPVRPHASIAQAASQALGLLLLVATIAVVAVLVQTAPGYGAL